LSRPSGRLILCAGVLRFSSVPDLLIAPVYDRILRQEIERCSETIVALMGGFLQ